MTPHPSNEYINKKKKEVLGLDIRRRTGSGEMNKQKVKVFQECNLALFVCVSSVCGE